MQWSSHPDACKNLTYDVPEPRGGAEIPHKRLGCFVPGAIIAQYYSGHDVYGPEDVFWVEATFKGAPGSEKSIKRDLPVKPSTSTITHSHRPTPRHGSTTNTYRRGTNRGGRARPATAKAH